MNRATSIFTALFFVGSLSFGRTSFASEETSSMATKTKTSPSSETGQGHNVLRDLALALGAGGEALRPFRGSTIENKDGKEPLNPAISGMDCTVDDIADYVSCYGSAIESKEEAGQAFTRVIDELQDALRSDRWRGVETEPGVDSIRSYTYEDQTSDAHIDIDLIARQEPEGKNSYMVSVFGWAATDPRL
jgi:hypothetical protein